MENIEKINKTKSWFFEKINKVDKTLFTLIKEKEKEDSNKIRSERGGIILDTTQTESIIRDYCNKKSFNKQKSKTTQLHWWSLPNI